MNLLLLDCHYLAYRALHTMGHLSHNEVKTGVVFGFLKDIVALRDDFASDVLVFCWDVGESKRRELYPAYKFKRHNKSLTEEEIAVYDEFRSQIKKLRRDYLPRIGFRNNFWQSGYESDDILASIVANVRDEDEAVIVTADRDLYQVLRHNVMVYNPHQHRMTTVQSFVREYGIKPKQWARVLAMAGCGSDEVEGIRGVGTKTAIKYLRGELKEDSVAYAAIEQGRDVVLRNKPLVKLPFEGTRTFEIQQDEVSERGWREVIDELGMRSLGGHAPVSSRKARASVPA